MTPRKLSARQLVGEEDRRAQGVFRFRTALGLGFWDFWDLGFRV